MRKQKARPQKKQAKPVPSVATPETEIDTSRRSFLRRARKGALAVAVLGAGGYFSVDYVQARMCEADLTKIGNGKPAIVQIHDPQCSMCRTLQGQTRGALKSLDEDSFNYLVANIKTQQGARLASRYGVPHVTLLLFDADGDMVQVVRGPSSRPVLEQILAGHVERHG